MKMHLAILTMPTGGFANEQPGKTIPEQVQTFRKYVSKAYDLLTENPIGENDILLFVMPEFHAKGDASLFQNYQDKKQLLEEYKNISRDFPSLIIMPTFNSHTSKEKNDAAGLRLSHKSKYHKVNSIRALLNGEVIFKHYKTNLGVADIPESEKKFFEHERSTYLSKKNKNSVLPGVFQINGITIGVDICVDYAMGVLKNTLKQSGQSTFTSFDMGVDIHVVSSSSLDNGLWQSANPNDNASFAGKPFSFFVQADGHGQVATRSKRSGVWNINHSGLIEKLHPISSQSYLDSEISIHHVDIPDNKNRINTMVPNISTQKPAC